MGNFLKEKSLKLHSTLLPGISSDRERGRGEGCSSSALRPGEGEPGGGSGAVSSTYRAQAATANNMFRSTLVRQCNTESKNSVSVKAQRATKFYMVFSTILIYSVIESASALPMILPLSKACVPSPTSSAILVGQGLNLT